MDPVPAARAGKLDQEPKPPDLRPVVPQNLVEKAEETAVELQGERREVTVLFVDATDFTAASHRLDSEDVYLVIDEIMRLLVEVVYKYEGTIDKFTGDGLMALFGAPGAHENDPERAVRAALEMQEVLQPLRARILRELKFDFQIRTGINTGQVVAGRLGSDLHMEYTVIGDTVNLASRLENAAEPGAILVSFSTYQRTHPLFRYKALPPLRIKGKPQPVPAFQCLGVRKQPGRVRGLPGLQAPMVGRVVELSHLQDALDKIGASGQSQVALVTGEAGMGKSRLVAEFCQTLAGRHVHVYEGNCLAYARSTPFWVVAGLLRHMLHIAEVDSAELQRDKLRAHLTKLDSLEHGEVMPYLLNVLGLEQADPGSAARLRRMDPVMLQRQIHVTMRQILMVEAKLAPTVLIFEDLHWVDPASRDFLTYLIRTIADVPLLLILVSRSPERKTTIQPLVSLLERDPERLVDIQLQALSEAEALWLIDQLLQGTVDQAQALKARIARRSGGIPFYIEEIVRMLIDQGGLVEADGGWSVVPQAGEMLTDVPGTLKGLILARFDSLSADLRRTLQAAAALGRSFPTGLLQLIHGEDSDAVAEHLEQIEERQFLTGEPFGGQTGFAFRHTLIQEAVYGTLLKRDRRQLHGRIAQAIERSTFLTPDERAEALAHHYAESLEPLRAIPYLLDAANNATRLSAHEVAVLHYRQVLALTADQPDISGHDYCRARIGLGKTLKLMGDFGEAARVLNEALQRLIAEQAERSAVHLSELLETWRELADVRQREGALDEAVRYLEQALDTLAQYPGRHAHRELWHSLMDRMAWVRFRQGDLEEASKLTGTAIREVEGEQASDPIVLASLYNTMGGILYQQGQQAEAIPFVEGGLQLNRELGYSWGIAIAHTNLGVLYYVEGKWPEAAGHYEQADIIRRENGFVAERAVNLRNLGLLHLAMGDHVQARQDFETSQAISQSLGDDYGNVCVEIELGHLAIIQGRFEDAAAHLQRAFGNLDAAGEDQEIQAHWLKALIQAEQNELQSAFQSARKALDMARSAGLIEEEAECLRVMGILQGRAGEFETAKELLRQSADLWTQRKDPYRQGQVLYELSRIYYRQALAEDGAELDYRAKAVEILQEAIDLFQSVGAIYDLQLAQEFGVELQSGSGPVLAAGDRWEHSAALRTGEQRPAHLPEAEWHRGAVVWLDIDFPADMDEEQAFEAASLVMRPLVAIAQEFQGQIIRRSEGITVVFGVPVAHENAPEWAVQAAWRMAQAVEKASGETGLAVTARLAVTAGEVVAGHVSRGSQVELMVKGKPIDWAHRVAQTMPPGKIWVTRAVQTATEHLFDYSPLNDAEQLGRSEPDREGLAELIGMRPEPGRTRGLLSLRARLIGRDAQIAAMTEWADRLDRGTGGLVWIEGEPGMGKSRLMVEFSSTVARQSQVLVWKGVCSPQQRAHAFSLFSDLLANALNLHSMDSTAQIRAKIDRALQVWPAEVRTVRPYLEMLCGLRPSEEEGEQLSTLKPDQLRQQLFIAVRKLLKSLAARQSLVLLLDDLHWVDPMSANLLLFVANLATTAPLLFVCAWRGNQDGSSQELPAQMIDLLAGYSRSIVLDRLSRQESESLLSHLLAAAKLPPLPADLHETILKRGDGNPYFFEEFVRMLVEQGYGHPSGEQAPGHASLDLAHLPIPASLETLIRSRVDTLPANLRALLQQIAVIGRPFQSSLLGSIAGQAGVQAGLHQLAERGLLQYEPDTKQWWFRHTLAASVVYNMILRVRRRTLHLKTAQALESYWEHAVEEHAEELAYHFTQAEAGDRSLVYLVMVGERAAAHYANEEALAFFQQAAHQLAGLPSVDPETRWRIAVGLGEVYRFIGAYDESIEALQLARPLAEAGQLAARQRAGLSRRLGETVRRQGRPEDARTYFAQALSELGEPEDGPGQVEGAANLLGIAWTYFDQGQFDEARQSCVESLRYAQEAGSLGELAAAENLLGGIYHQQGMWALALEHTTKAMELRKQMGYTWGVAASLSNLGILAASSGDWHNAQTYFERSLALRQEIGDLEGMAIVHGNLGWLCLDQGDLERSQHHFQAGLNIAEPSKMVYHAANLRLGWARMLLARGEIERAQQTIGISREQAESIDAQELLCEIFRAQAEILLARSAWFEAEEMAGRAVALIVEIGNHSLEASAWRILAECQCSQANFPAARQSLAKAEQALAYGAKELESGRVAAQWARLYSAVGDLAAAESHVQKATTIFTRLGAATELARLQAGFPLHLPANRDA